jgi:hypothetical protein
MKFEVGQTVTLTDFSYGYWIDINSRKLSDWIKSSGNDTGMQWVIVAKDCVLPTRGEVSHRGTNTLVLQSLKNNAIVFTQEQFIRPLKREIIIDGKTISISEESFQELRRQLL